MELLIQGFKGSNLDNSQNAYESSRLLGHTSEIKLSRRSSASVVSRFTLSNVYDSNKPESVQRTQ